MSFAKQFAFKSSRRALVYGLGLAAFGGLSVAYHLSKEAARQEDALQKQGQYLSNFKVYELNGREAVEYPWQNGKIDEWEYRPVKVRGFFSGHRVFVKRQKDGKEGYLVLAPFYTYHFRDLPHNFLNDEEKFHELEGNAGGLWVNLGWVPTEHKKEIESTDTPIEPIDLTDKFSGNSFIDPDTGFEYKKEYNADWPEPEFKFIELTAIVRRGERWNPLAGHINMPKEGLFRFIDLDLLSRLVLFSNRQNSRSVYLERIVESTDQNETTYPIPLSKSNLAQGNPDSVKTRALASKATLASVASLVLMAPALLI
jgi:surfeit locus 1 family protein